MTRHKLAIGVLLFAAFMAAIAAFLPLLKGASMNVTFLSVAVVFFVLGLVTARKSRENRFKTPG